MTDNNKEEIDNLLLHEQWKWNTLTPENPFEFILENDCKMGKKEFNKLHNYLLLYFPNGYSLKGYNYFANIDIYKRISIVRKRIFNQFDKLENPTAPHYSEEMLKEISDEIQKLFPYRKIFEIACGCGTLVKATNISDSFYRGCDPSAKAIMSFKNNLPDFAHTVHQLSFEECFNLWHNTDEVIVATFGAPNYVMRRYLCMLADNHRNIYLMFYKPDYCPLQFKDMHTNSYSEQELKEIFPDYEINEYHDYLIVKG